MAEERRRPNADLEALRWNVTRMFALFALVLGKVARVRFVETFADGHSQTLDSEMPPLAELAGALESALAGHVEVGAEQRSPPADASVAPNPLWHDVGNAEHSAGAAIDMRALVDAILRNPEPKYAGTRSLGSHGDASVGPNHDGLRILRATLAQVTKDGPRQPRDRTLVINVDLDSGRWSVDLTRPRRLAGENLERLRRTGASAAPHSTPPSSSTASGQLTGPGYLSAAEAAMSLGVSKSTITRRIERDRMVGFRLFKDALQIPKDQLLDGDVVPGIPAILALFARPDAAGHAAIDHKNAWMFLASDIFRGDRDPRPIDRLRRAARTATTESVVAELTHVKGGLDRGDHM